jgi:exodeoxyribonuclease-5
MNNLSGSLLVETPAVTSSAQSASPPAPTQTALAMKAAVSTQPIQLNEQQEAALESLLNFISDPDPDDNFYVLSGFAGTGKTFLMREVIARSSRSKVKFAFTAPTNKAAKVLRSVTGDACTIYSLLGLRISATGEVKELITSEVPIDLSDLDVVFIDEGSMVNKKLIDILRIEAAAHRLKIVFMGDRMQLPPVKETESPIWKMGIPTSTLTKVMRHDNQILQLVTQIREKVDHFSPNIEIKSNNSGAEGVWKLTQRAFKEAIYKAAGEGWFTDGVKGKIIAWRNVRVAEYNNLVRSAVFGAEAVGGYFLPGDRIIATEPCLRGEDVLLATDDEAIVESVLTCQHPIEGKYKCLELKCLTERKTVIRLLTLHPESASTFDLDCENLAHRAKVDPKLWKTFWILKGIFHQVKYAYAITAHRSQGSTYESCFVDYQDILYNRNRREAFQCLYVACSRPTARLFLA